MVHNQRILQYHAGTKIIPGTLFLLDFKSVWIMSSIRFVERRWNDGNCAFEILRASASPAVQAGQDGGGKQGKQALGNHTVEKTHSWYKKIVRYTHDVQGGKITPPQEGTAFPLLEAHCQSRRPPTLSNNDTRVRIKQLSVYPR